MTQEDFFDEEEFLPDELPGGVEELMQEIESKWGELASAVRGLSAAELLTADVVGHWSVRDVIAHIGAWEQEGARRIDVIVNGQGAELTWPTRAEEDAFNADAVEACRGLSADQVIKRLEDSHRDFMELLAAFGDELPSANLEVPPEEWIPGWTYLHYQEHAPQILAFRYQRTGRAENGG